MTHLDLIMNWQRKPRKYSSETKILGLKLSKICLIKRRLKAYMNMMLIKKKNLS